MKLILFILFLIPSISSANTLSKVIDLEIYPDLLKHQSHLVSPSYIYLYLQNEGMSVTNFQKVIVESKKILKIGPGTIEFKKIVGDNYYYNVSIKNSLFFIDGSLVISIDQKDNKVSIFIEEKLKNLLPIDYLPRLQLRFNSIFNLYRQELLSRSLDYNVTNATSLEEYLITQLYNPSKTMTVDKSIVSAGSRATFLWFFWFLVLILIIVKKRRSAKLLSKNL